MRILIAEDEACIAKVLKLLLEKNRFAVDVVYNGLDALDYINTGVYDAAVLDVMMPGMSGLEVIKRARKSGVTTPMLLMSAKGEVDDRIAGLDAGADDYLPKPFASSEFISRVRALVRRSDAYSSDVLSLGNTALDCNQYALRAADRSVRLNNKEFQLMVLFFRHPRQVFSSDHLMEKIWGLDSDAGVDVVWTYIGFLRKKLRQLNASIEIKTIRGAGYSLEEAKPPMPEK